MWEILSFFGCPEYPASTCSLVKVWVLKVRLLYAFERYCEGAALVDSWRSSAVLSAVSVGLVASCFLFPESAAPAAPRVLLQSCRGSAEALAKVQQESSISFQSLANQYLGNTGSNSTCLILFASRLGRAP